MITHYILLSSSYSKGKRIGLDFIIENNTVDSKIREIVTKINTECGNDVSLSTHFIQTNSSEWNSVVEKDFFFRDVEIIDSVTKFINLIKKDRKLIGLDVAKYILCKIQCTHLKLEKLVYLCYAEYLCDFNKVLFEDKIYAYRYGPVTKSVYDKYKGYGYKEIDENEIVIESISEMPAKSRILFAENGLEKIKSIDSTLNKYGNFSAAKLVEITHRKLTPWEVTGRGLLINRIIEKDVILEYHVNEYI